MGGGGWAAHWAGWAGRFDQHHAPAGSPSGGQFSSGGDAGGSKGRKRGTVETPTGSYPPDVDFMTTEDVGRLTSDLDPDRTVEQRYQSKTADETQDRIDAEIAKHGWHPSPLEVLNGERLTNGHHTYAAARRRGVTILPVRHYRRAKATGTRG